MAQIPEEPAPPAWISPGYVPASGVRVLVVEDEHLVALDIQVRLTRMGFMSTVAFSGEDAVTKASEEHFDLVLMDIKLKGAMDGIEAVHSIHTTQDVPVIYLTAYADGTTIQRARVTEPYGYVLKPFNDRELKATIEIALQRHTSERIRDEQRNLQLFLSEVSARLAESLDYRTVASAIADLLVPRYADWCLIHLRETEDRIPAFTFVRPGPSQNVEPGPDAHAIADIERLQQARVLTRLERPEAARDVVGSAYLDAMRKVGAACVLCVPLVTRQEILGSLCLVAGRDRPAYGSHDLALVEDVAHRLAMALDNALLYRRAERAIRIRDDVLAIVSHDLRSPLATVMLRAQAIVRNEELAHVGLAILRSASRMNRLIGDLLDASAINAGKLTLDVREHDMTEIIHEACEMFRSSAEQRGIALVEEAPAAVTRVRCDRDRVLQVFSNLLSNALKYTRQGGKVAVAARRTDDRIRAEVRDTGIGIAADQVPHLFDRFWQARGRHDGAGLGLYIARGIVVAHSSELAVESTVGSGSSFSFTLPLAP
jgi:signal transduction histidine kinase/CheY-like chemotaxis protein